MCIQKCPVYRAQPVSPKFPNKTSSVLECGVKIKKSNFLTGKPQRLQQGASGVKVH